MKVLYTATATAKGGREGHVRSDDGRVDLDLSVPRELGGAGGEGANPEQLFAAGYAACFESAVRYEAAQRNIKHDDVSVTCHVGIGPREASGFGLTVRLDVHIGGVDHDMAQTLIEAAHRDICPYSHATRGNVDVDVSLAP
ncbi:organic hydroperoxide resistance protein [Oleiagrimonas sp. C23AA]|uniref:organic hydroperoxide resistance protein n=1 Tax=Oleiagrimonas sp. C23AA TaxID=2719047 RepID=UPI0014244FB9|nr:organic hydroperoxide resistance protein [Oleiagrimonas sp. C23AA]NII09317.1 organic hydroperoxide resistance protein [Oleiagrimonas sp. C23AA]